MSGATKILKPGQILFRAGDPSDGMYLVRKGELCVFLENKNEKNDPKEVVLAKVGPGGMIGEMALFDQNPRSASVKAVELCEVTQISQEDFAKLMKQIPKWFVSLMSSLSSRLRTTNDRLRQLEGLGNPNKRPYHSLIRQLNIIQLLWLKDGVKTGKEITLSKSLVETKLVEQFSEEPGEVKKMLDVLNRQQILVSRMDQFKNIQLVAPNRNLLQNLPDFFQKFVSLANGKRSFSQNDVGMLRLLEKMVLKSPYDGISIALKDLEKEASLQETPSESWPKFAEVFLSGFEEVKAVKSASGITLKTTKKEISGFIRMLDIVAACDEADLS